ncbi:MAG: SAVED domain-containing protein [Acidobacteria bacterium]|nr:SAVED domain-containing protein [Acidobacteriota bacterium]
MDIWNLLSRLDNIVGLSGAVLAALFSAYTAWRLRLQNKRLIEIAHNAPPIEDFPQLIKAYEGVITSHPVALAISLLPNNESIRQDVETFLRYQNWEMDVEELNMNGLKNQADFESFINQLREKRRVFDAEGHTEIHLFIAGPVQAGVLVGAMFDNWRPVKLYHKPQNPPPQIYEYWMPLTK